MAIEYKNIPPEWKNAGTEPTDDKKTNGFQPKYKLPAAYLNWIVSFPLKCIKEIQELFKSHADSTKNPHNVTAEQVGLGKVNNTADSEKNVAFASEAGVGRKVEYPLTVRYNGGSTEGTDKWTYDGSTSRSINITPEKISAAKKDLSNVDETDFRGKIASIGVSIEAIRTVSNDIEIYTATITGVTELYNGMKITIIPNANNTTLSPRLNINGLGDKTIRLPLSFNCAATNALKTNFLQTGRPVELKYDANCNLGIQGDGAWLFTDRQKTSAQDLYGSVPVESGGTGASTAAEACANLGTCRFAKGRATQNADGNCVITTDFEVKVLFVDLGDCGSIWFEGETTMYYRDPGNLGTADNVTVQQDGTTITVLNCRSFTWAALG